MLHRARGLLWLYMGLFCFSLNAILLDLPVFLNERPLGMGYLLLDEEEGPIGVDGATLLTLLKDQVRLESLNGFQRSWDGEGILHLPYEEGGMHILYQEEEQTLAIYVAPEWLQRSECSLCPGRESRREPFLSPARHSGYINLLFGQKVTLESQGNREWKRPNATLFSTDFSLNFHGWVAEGFGNLGGPSQTTFNRGDFRLTRDFSDRGFRLSLGDVYFPSIAFQRTVPLWGISFYHNRALFSSPLVGAINREEIFLNQPSRVDVYENDLLLGTLELPAGPHLITDLPLHQGANSLELRITDVTGRQEVIDLSYLYDATLLHPRETQWSATLGFPRFNGLSCNYDYEWRLPTFSGYWRRGINRRLTGGLYLQANSEQACAGMQWLALLSYARATFEIGMSRHRFSPCALATRFSLQGLVRARSKIPWNWYLSAEYYGKRFFYLGDYPWMICRFSPLTVEGNFLYRERIYNDRAFQLVGTLSHPFLCRFTCSWTGTMTFLRPPRYFEPEKLGKIVIQKGSRASPFAYSLQFFCSRPLLQRFNFSLLTSYEHGYSFRRNLRMVFGLIYTGKSGLSGSSYYNTRYGESTNSLYYSTNLPGGRSFSGSAGVTTGSQLTTGLGSATYRGFKGIASIQNYLARTTVVDPGSWQSIGQIYLGTGIVFVKNHWTMTRPVSDSFIMVAPRRYIEGYPLLVNPTSDGGYLARSTGRSPLVIPEVTSYSPYRLEVRCEDLPIGQELRESSFEVLPTYRSGTLIEVGEPPTVFAEGYLFYASGEPLTKSVGVLASLDPGEGEEILFFTNRSGRFQVEGLSEGSYELRMRGYSHQPLVVEIPPDGGPIHDMGPLTLYESEDVP